MIGADVRFLYGLVGPRRALAVVVGCAALGAGVASLTVAWLTQPPLKES